MSEAQRRLLRLIAKGPIDIREAARRLHTTVAGVSNTRTVLLVMGYVEPWELWQGPIVITDDGRAAIECENKRTGD